MRRQILLFANCLRVSLCACVVFNVGCASGLRPFRTADTADPFLDDDEAVELVADGRMVATRETEPERDPPVPEPVVDLRARSEPDSDGTDLAMFADSASRGPSRVDQAGYEQIAREREPRRSVDAGLGTASPWGPAATPPAMLGSGVSLGFEDDAEMGDFSAGNGAGGIGIEITDPEAGDFAPLDDLLPATPPQNREANRETAEMFNAEPAPRADEKKEDRRWGFDRGFGLFGRADDEAEPAAEEPTEEDFDPVDVIEDRLRKEGRSIRDRFSRLGARLGIGGEEDDPAASAEVVPDSLTPPRACIDELIEKTRSRVTGLRYNRLSEPERDDYLREHVNLRLFYLIDGQHERALDAIPGIPPSEQEFWQQMFWSLSQYRDAESMPDRTERITQTVSQLRAALQRLQENARLQLLNVSFCKRIDGYGSYERFETDVFQPGQQVLVYAEVDNFKSEPTTSGQYRTLLRSTLQIFPEDGSDKPVDRVTLRAVEDVCRNPRRDYFNSYEFTIPNDIGRGRYALELTIEDRLSGKSTKQSILFTVR